MKRGRPEVMPLLGWLLNWLSPPVGAADPTGNPDTPTGLHPPPRKTPPDSQSLGATLSGGGSSGKRPWAPPSSSSRSSRAGRGGDACGVCMARARRQEVTPAGEGRRGERPCSPARGHKRARESLSRSFTIPEKLPPGKIINNNSGNNNNNTQH